MNLLKRITSWLNRKPRKFATGDIVIIDSPDNQYDGRKCRVSHVNTLQDGRYAVWMQMYENNDDAKPNRHSRLWMYEDNLTLETDL